MWACLKLAKTWLGFCPAEDRSRQGHMDADVMVLTACCSFIQDPRIRGGVREAGTNTISNKQGHKALASLSEAVTCPPGISVALLLPKDYPMPFPSSVSSPDASAFCSHELHQCSERVPRSSFVLEQEATQRTL